MHYSIFFSSFVYSNIVKARNAYKKDGITGGARMCYLNSEKGQRVARG